MPEFLNPAEAEFWVGVGLLIFLGVVIFVAKAPAKIGAALDAQAQAIQANLDEALDVAKDLGNANPGGAYEIRPVGVLNPGQVTK